MKKAGQAGQAILEMTVAMVALSFLILGVIFMTGLCIGNVDLLLSARENADRGSVNSDSGSAGSEVANWSFDRYQKANGEEVELRYLTKDRPLYSTEVSTGDFLEKMALSSDSASTHPEDEEYYEQYKFVPLEELPQDQSSSTFSEMVSTWDRGYLAASLIRGTPEDDLPEITTLNASGANGSFTAADVQKMETAFAQLFGVDPSHFDLQSAESNRVYMPASILPGNEPAGDQ